MASQQDILGIIQTLKIFVLEGNQTLENARASYQTLAESLRTVSNQQQHELELWHKKNLEQITQQVGGIQKEAQRIQTEMSKLEQQLETSDKCYHWTKKRKESQGFHGFSDKYAEEKDYYHNLEILKEDFQTLSEKYRKNIPIFISGIHFLCSQQRKDNYVSLISLEHTFQNFFTAVENQLPDVLASYQEGQEKNYLTQVEMTLHKEKEDLSHAETNFHEGMNQLMAQFSVKIDDMHPQASLEQVLNICNDYAKSFAQVNSDFDVAHEILAISYLHCPLDYFSADLRILNLMKEKFGKFLHQHGIAFPLFTSTVYADPIYLLVPEQSVSKLPLDFVHGQMFRFLSSAPVGALRFSVIDPENHGTSISPYFTAKKQVPQLFPEDIYIQREEISFKIKSLNRKIQEIQQNILGNQYETIAEYAKDKNPQELSLEFLAIFDFPRGFDNQTLVDLRNILRHGQACGIYTIMTYQAQDYSNVTQETQKLLQNIIDLSTPLQEKEGQFTLENFAITFESMPEKNQFEQFLSRYILVLEGLEQKGIAFSPLVREFLEADSQRKIKEKVQNIIYLWSQYQKNYGKVPSEEVSFPDSLTLGSIDYPVDIFQDCLGLEHMKNHFSTEEENALRLPFMVDLRKHSHFMCQWQKENQQQMIDFTHHILWSFLSSMPVSKINISVLDIDARGNSIVPFLELKKRVPDIFDGEIFTNPQSIYEQLLSINRHMDYFIQEKLSNQYEDIFDYNAHTTNRSESMKILMIYDFPQGMDQRNLQLLTSILKNGNKCGIFVILSTNPVDVDKEVLDEFTEYCTTFFYNKERYRLMPYQLPVNLPETISQSQISQFTKEYKQRDERNKKQGIAFEDILPNSFFQWNTADSLEIPIGIGDGDQVVSMTLGQGSSHHGLIAGVTGSGKSTLLHTLITSCMLHYSPDQLHLYLMDFKSGTEFKVYETTHLPHVQLLALDAMQEFGESILENLVSEMERRSNLFKEAGESLLGDYLRTTKEKLPRILVVMDEFQILYNDSTNRKIAMHCGELTKRLVTEGRAYGIHILMATQSTKDIYTLSLSQGTLEQMRVRIGLKCGESDARHLFSDQNDRSALDRMKGPLGTAVMTHDYTELGTHGLRVVYCDKENQQRYLEKISHTYRKVPSKLKTFEGGRTTTLLSYFRKASLQRCEQYPVTVHMGEAIKVAPPWQMVLDKKRKHNLLICGSDDLMTNHLCHNFMISLLLHQNAELFLLDGEYFLGDSPLQGFYRTLRNHHKNQFHLGQSNQDIFDVINQVYQRFIEKSQSNSSKTTVIFLKHLQFLNLAQAMFRGEQVEEASTTATEEPSEPVTDANPFAFLDDFVSNRSVSKENTLSIGDKLLKIINEGSRYDIHVVITCQDYQTIRDCMYYSDNILAKFQERILFALSTQDAGHLMDIGSMAHLGEHTVSYSDGIYHPYQVKPYKSPTSQELEQFYSGKKVKLGKKEQSS